MILEVFGNEDQVDVAAFPKITAGIRTIEDQLADVDASGFYCFTKTRNRF